MDGNLHFLVFKNRLKSMGHSRVRRMFCIFVKKRSLRGVVFDWNGDIGRGFMACRIPLCSALDHVKSWCME